MINRARLYDLKLLDELLAERRSCIKRGFAQAASALGDTIATLKENMEAGRYTFTHEFLDRQAERDAWYRRPVEN